MSETATPEIVVINDYDGVFEKRVKDALLIAVASGKPIKFKKITVNAQPFMPYCLEYKASGETLDLLFYSAARNFGYNHTIQDVADTITLV